MSREKTVESTTDDGLAESAEAFHEARANSEGVLDEVEVEAVTPTGTEDSTGFVARLDRAGDEMLVEFGTRGKFPRETLLDQFDGADYLGDLTGTTHDMFVEPSDHTLRWSEDGAVVAERADPHYMKRYGDDTETFDRKLALERAADSESSPPAAEVELSATGDGESVVITAEFDGHAYEWTLDVPDAATYEESPLRRLLDAVGAGDPEDLDGHSAYVTGAHLLRDRTHAFTSDGGEAAILPWDNVRIRGTTPGNAPSPEFVDRVAALVLVAVGVCLAAAGASSMAPALIVIPGLMVCVLGIVVHLNLAQDD